jgi:hypothetical protein
MWYYKQTEPQLWTVGHGEGKDWTTDSDHDSQDSASGLSKWRTTIAVVGSSTLAGRNYRAFRVEQYGRQ